MTSNQELWVKKKKDLLSTKAQLPVLTFQEELGVLLTLVCLSQQIVHF